MKDNLWKSVIFWKLFGDSQVIDKAERLREMDANILPAFLGLQELVCIFEINFNLEQ